MVGSDGDRLAGCASRSGNAASAMGLSFCTNLEPVLGRGIDLAEAELPRWPIKLCLQGQYRPGVLLGYVLARTIKHPAEVPQHKPRRSRILAEDVGRPRCQPVGCLCYLNIAIFVGRPGFLGW